MGGSDLETYARRLGQVLEVAPPQTQAETISWVLQPLFGQLGWHVDEYRSSGAMGLQAPDLCLTLDHTPPTPAVIVAVESADAALSTDRLDAIGAAMTNSGIDRGLYSNGHRFMLLAGDGTDRAVVTAGEVGERSGVFSQLSRSTLDAHCCALPAEELRRRRLVVFRESLAESIESLIDDSLGSTPTIDEEAVVHFVESQVEGGSKGEESQSAVQATVRSRVDSSPTPESSPDELPSETDSPSDIPSSVRPAADPAGEYVVRVFGERGSIGAVGHSTSAGALAEAAAYFFERGLSGIRIPWGPEDEAVVLNDEPVDESGSRWSAFERLPNNLYVTTEGSLADRADRVESLASRAGYRVMLTGDWEN